MVYCRAVCVVVMWTICCIHVSTPHVFSSLLVVPLSNVSGCDLFRAKTKTEIFCWMLHIWMFDFTKCKLFDRFKTFFFFCSSYSSNIRISSDIKPYIIMSKNKYFHLLLRVSLSFDTVSFSFFFIRISMRSEPHYAELILWIYEYALHQHLYAMPFVLLLKLKLWSLRLSVR